MRRTHEEVKAELLRRRDDYFVQQKKRRKAAATLTASGIAAVMLVAVCLPRIPRVGEDLPTDSELTDEPECEQFDNDDTQASKGESTQVLSTAASAQATCVLPDKTFSEETTLLEPNEEPMQATDSDGDTVPDAEIPTQGRTTSTVVEITVGTYPTTRCTSGPLTTSVHLSQATLAPHGSANPYRGALADFTPVSVRLPYEGNAVQVLTAEATALWEYSVQLTDRPLKTEVGEETIGAHYVVFRDADGYELTCLYCDTCIALGQYWYDITEREAAALQALLDALK